MGSKCHAVQVVNVPFDLQICIEDSLDLVAIKASEKGLELAYLLENDVPKRIVGDSNRLRQVLVNLLGNAVKFTDRGDVVLRSAPDGLKGVTTRLSFTLQSGTRE